MTARVLIFWALSITAFFCCTFIFIEEDTSLSLKPNDITSLFIVEPHSFYYSNDKYHANVAGQLKLEIKTESFIQNLLEYNVLVINGLEIDLNSTISLNWMVDNQPHQTPLNANTFSINRINFNTTDALKISDLHLLISSNFELGTRPNAQKEVSFKSVYLDTTQNHSAASVELNQWIDYTPIKFNSINGYSSSENLHFKTLIQRLSIWILINVVLFILLKVSGHQLIISLSLAWLIILGLFTNNFIKQNQQIKTAFALDDQFLNQQDISANELAQELMAKIQSIPNINTKQQKFIIVGENDFYHLRLYHHLMGLNVSIHNSYVKLLMKNDATKQYIYILTNKHKDYCNTGIKSDEPLAEIIGQEAHYCLMRKI